MTSIEHFWQQGDLITRSVAALLLLMSVSAWVLIFWKGWLLRRVQAMATQSNLTIRGFTPQVVAKKQIHMEWPIGLKLEGRYHDLGAFLERVSKFPRIINVGNIHIKAQDGSASATVTAECTATTFVLIETKAPAATPAGAARTE